MSRFVLMSEATYRLQWNRFSADLMGGADSSLEVPHSSRFYRSDERYPRVVFDDGPMLQTTRLPLQGSAYVFSEVRFSPISIAGGTRFNGSLNSYKSIWVSQLNAAARFFGDNYLKFGFTQGMRPPTILDRAGLRPVEGISTLTPERSKAYQGEFNSAFSIPGLLKRGSVRVDFAYTTLESTITREENLTSPFLSTPIVLKPSNIATWEGLAQLEFTVPLELTVAYTNTKVSAPKFDQPSVTGIEPNHGPTHHGTLMVAYDILGTATVQPSLEVQCGGSWRIVYPAADVENVTPVQKQLGCYYIANVSLRLPSRPRDVSLMITLRNLLDARPPPADFLFPELRGAEAPLEQLRGRAIFATLQWSPWGGDI